MIENQLIIFTRFPEPGKTKTRLIPLLGEQGASELHRRMTEATIKQAKILLDDNSLSVKICFTGGTIDDMKNWLGGDLIYQVQQGEGLGDRMKFAFTEAFLGQMTQVVMIGTDCPDLTASIIQQAFAALSAHDLVLGPAQDGGYYLIGLKRVFTELFTGIAWGTDTVLAKTLEIARTLGLKIALLPVLRDIDRPEDIDN
jgi:uncharacterized protein